MISPSAPAALPHEPEGLRIICHVAAVHHDSGTVAVECSDDGWLLPTYVLPPHTPHRPILITATSLLPMPAVPRCIAFPRLDPTTHTMDRLLIADAVKNGGSTSRGLTMMDMATLQQGRALIPYQLAAIQRLNQPLANAGIGMQPLWLNQVRDWVMDVAGLTSTPLLTWVDIYRASEHRLVVAFATGGRVLHFKVCGRSGVQEALLTQLIADRCPTVAVPTLAYLPAQRWWLTAHVDGDHLDASFWPAQLTALDAWIALQRELGSQEQTLAAHGVSRFDDECLRAAVADAIETVESNRLPERVQRHRPWTASERIGDLVRERVECVLNSPVYRESPQGLLHFDFAPRNILWNGVRPVFIDFDNVHIGPSSICGALMARRAKDSLTLLQRQELSLHGARASLSTSTRKTEETLLGYVEALTDLHLLAFRHAAHSHQTPNADVDAPAPYSWSHVVTDFVSRVRAWSIS